MTGQGRSLGTLSALLGLLLTLLLPTSALAQDGWESHRDPASGYEIDLPIGLFDSYEVEDGIISMRDEALDAVLQVYAGSNPDGLSLAGFIDFLAGADRIAEVTYQTGGRTWFVISGYYRRDTADPGPLIFYAKFMFSPGLERFAAFEISYPQALKRDLDPIVARLESSLRAPS